MGYTSVDKYSTSVMQMLGSRHVKHPLYQNVVSSLGVFSVNIHVRICTRVSAYSASWPREVRCSQPRSPVYIASLEQKVNNEQALQVWLLARTKVVRIDATTFAQISGILHLRSLGTPHLN